MALLAFKVQIFIKIHLKTQLITYCFVATDIHNIFFFRSFAVVWECYQKPKCQVVIFFFNFKTRVFAMCIFPNVLLKNVAVKRQNIVIRYSVGVYTFQFDRFDRSSVSWDREQKIGIASSLIFSTYVNVSSPPGINRKVVTNQTRVLSTPYKYYAFNLQNSYFQFSWKCIHTYLLI